MAVDSGWGDRVQTVWVNCTAWGKLAEEVVAKFARKGAKVDVHGELTVDRDTGEPRIWFDSAGNPHASYAVTISKFTVAKFAEGQDQDENVWGDEEEDDEIPF
jgi:single-stranded DNA-binding protein